jgi:hypothetical protein
VTGQHDPQAAVGGQRPELVKGPQVIAERPVFGDYRGAPPEHRVPGEQRTVRDQHEAQRVAGVSRGRHHPQLAAASAQHRACRETFGAEPVRRVKRGHRRAGQLGEPRGARGVIRVPVGEDDLRHPAIARGRHGQHPAQVRLVVRSRVHHEH